MSEASRRPDEFFYRFESNYRTLPLHLENIREKIDREIPINTDALYFGNEMRFVNHSCSANSKSKEIPIFNSHETLFGINMIFAEKEIEPGEEITMNYHWQNSENIDKDIDCYCFPGC